MKVKYLSPIDPHVHLRGEEYPCGDFVEKAHRDAEHVGLAAMYEMPNASPNLINDYRVASRLASIAKRCGERSWDYGLHVGLTDDPSQVAEALDMVRNQHNRIFVKGDKTFYGHSTGRMGLLSVAEQARLWKIKADMGYEGVSIGHFEEESLFNTATSNHCARRPWVAEYASVRAQLVAAAAAGFRGTFYIAHVTCPEIVDLAERAQYQVPFRIVVEVTWHHLFLSVEDYREMGSLVKMNPPLRAMRQRMLLKMLVQGRKIDVIGSDHAPHPYEDKFGEEEAVPSGIPALPFWPKGIELLRKCGVPEDRIERLTFHAANEIFDGKIEPRTVEVEYDPGVWKERYGFNPFQRVDRPNYEPL